MRSIEDIIIEKNYQELSPEELVLVSELAENEQEYAQMKQLFDNIGSEFAMEETFAASTETKNSLDQIFSAKHPVIANDWKKEEAVVEEAKVVAFYNRSWVRVAAILLLFFGISVLYIQNSEEIKATTEPQQAKADIPAGSSSGKTLSEDKNSGQETLTASAGAPNETNSAEVAKAETEVSPAVAPVFLRTVAEPSFNYSVDNLSFANGATTTAFTATSLAGNATGTYYFTTAKGLASDLYPDGEVIDENTASISDVPASEMLDWIQAAY